MRRHGAMRVSGLVVLAATTATGVVDPQTSR